MTASSSKPLIELVNVCKAFTLPGGGRFDAVRDASLSVQAGDIFGLVGRSGAGKSTLLRLINLLEVPDAGGVHVAGQDLTALSKSALREARQSIGMIFQQFNLLQNATVSDNVAFPLRIHGRGGRAQVDERVRECLAIVGLSDKAASYPAQLSGGQKQRVAIARALASHPKVLLCDEPTSALDSETTEGILATLRDINQRLGVTIVIVTHELPVVSALCRHAAVIDDGRLVEQLDLRRIGTPHTRAGQALARLLGQPAAARELSHA
jgi:D-methionine transport system ATP-binding protein